MTGFKPKSFPQITADMAAKIAAETPITDFNPGSVILTLLEAAAQEDFNQYIQMLQVIRNYNLDTTEGEDLDKRAFEHGLTRLAPRPHSGFVSVKDARFTKVTSKIFAGLPGPVAGSTIINVDDGSEFPASGELYIGRGTPNSEGPIEYSAAPVDNTSYWTITLDTALLNDHGTDEFIVLSQFGDRNISAGTEVEIPANDFSAQILFELNQNVTLFDGEDLVENVLVTALEPGGFSVPSNSISNFVNAPFTGATVFNPLPFVNGRDEESDQDLRDRIRDDTQSLSRGTTRSVRNGIIGLVDGNTNSSIVSAKVVAPVILADGPTKVYIDNGRGLEPSLAPIGLEILSTSATGGEQFFQLQNFSLVKAQLVSQRAEPFALFGGESLIIRIGTTEETFNFLSTDFVSPGNAKAVEVSQAINARSNIFESRTITDNAGRRIIITPIANQNEEISIDPTSSAQAVMNFPDREISTLKLYKNDALLNKDGLTASLISAAQPFDFSASITNTTDGDFTVTAGSRVVSKSAIGLEPIELIIAPGDYVKFSGDPDSAYTRVQTVVSDLKLILQQEYPPGGGIGNIVVWNSPQLEIAANGDLVETEVITFSPNDFGNPAQALASEVLARLNIDLNLSKAELAVNNTRILLISERENDASSRIQVLGGAAAVSMGFCTSQPISGQISTAFGSRSVTGNGTQFLSELQENQWIKVGVDGSGAWTKIESIESDTQLYLKENYRGSTSANVLGVSMNFSELAQGKNRDYILNRSNGQIELVEPLQLGDTLTAGSINTRAFVDSSVETFDFDSLGASSNLIVRIDGGIEAAVTTPDLVGPYNTFNASSLIGFASSFFTGFHIEWISGNNLGETSSIGSYDESTGQLVTITAFPNPISNSDRFILSQSIEFVHASDFADPTNVSALEVVAAINSKLLGGAAERLSSGRVRMRTTNFQEQGSIQVLGGSANSLLSFSLESNTNQETNTAFVTSTASDRGGTSLAPGFTLGPGQNLVAIIDGDNTNKTFSIPLSVSESADSGGSNSFTSAALGSKYTQNSFFNNFWVYWTVGANEGSVQIVDSYNGITGQFSTSSILPDSTPLTISAGDEFSLVPRTANNVVALLNDLNTTTISVVARAEATGIQGDLVQLSTKTPGSPGKVFITGGTANRFGITVESIVPGSPVNDLTLNSRAGLSKGLPVLLTADGSITVGDSTAPFDTFASAAYVSALPTYFNGMQIEITSGLNAGHKTTISNYDNTTGEFVLTDAASTPILIGTTFRISKPAFIADLTGTSAPYTVFLNDEANSPIDVQGFTPQRAAAIRDWNGLNFSTTQVEGIDGYKFFTGLIQLAQWTIDGLDRDPSNYPGIGASGTQFEVLTPVLVSIKLIIDVTTEEGINLSAITNNVSSAVSGYVNSRKVGEDVILSEIVAAVQGVSGVFDVTIQNHESNITIADGELARLADSDLIIG
jgi:uncharacterized phage protein gp47/JayE